MELQEWVKLQQQVRPTATVPTRTGTDVPSECVAAYTNRPLFPITCGKLYSFSICSVVRVLYLQEQDLTKSTDLQEILATNLSKLRGGSRTCSLWLIDGDASFSLMKQMYF